MTTVSRSQVATARDARDGLAVGRQVFRSNLVQTSEHLKANSEPNPVDNIQPVQLTSPEMSEDYALLCITRIMHGEWRDK